MTDVSIVGVGMHKFGRFGEKSADEMAHEAMADAGVSWRDIEVAYLSTMYQPATSGARMMRPLGATGIPIFDVEAACASGGVALRQAMLALQAGAHDLALVVGVEKMPKGFINNWMLFEPWQVEMGMSANPSYWAMHAKRHMYEYGTTEMHIAKLAYKNHKNSVRNPYAMYRKLFSIDEIMHSPLVCDPIHLYEICAPNEGAAAIVLASEKKARQLKAKPVRVRACVHSLALYSADFRVPRNSMSATSHNPGPTTVTARKAYEAAGIGPEAINCFEVQDTDAFCELEIYEHLGLCPAGEAGRLIDEGVTESDGKYPVNVSGGLICKGEPVGASHLGQLTELTWQLRGQAEARQIPGAKTALGQVLGAGGNCVVTILEA
jgi:acetyl-CoA acetyltransferase